MWRICTTGVIAAALATASNLGCQRADRSSRPPATGPAATASRVAEPAMVLGGESELIARLASTGTHDQLSAEEKVVFCVWWVEAEINNGGFHQYYRNSAGDHATDVPAYLDVIGATKAAAIVRRANALFGPSGPSNDRHSRDVQLKALSAESLKALHALDDEFYKYPDDIERLLKRYVQSHPADFSR